MADKGSSLQDMFLNAVRRSKAPVTMFLVKGVKLQGVITWFDNFSVLLRRDGHAQLVYKHAISTIMPGEVPDLAEIVAAHATPSGAKKPPPLQEAFLGAVCKSGDSVTMFLVNGVMLQGDVIAYDQFCLLLRRDDLVQLVYKHAISTVQPDNPIHFSDAAEGEQGD